MESKRSSRWERAGFDVPANISDEQVQAGAGVYQRRFGEHLERQGFIILQMLKPVVAGKMEHQILTDPDRRRYHIFALVTRKPVTTHFDIPDVAVPAMQKIGLTLQE